MSAHAYDAARAGVLDWSGFGVRVDCKAEQRRECERAFEETTTIHIVTHGGVIIAVRVIPRRRRPAFAFVRVVGGQL